MTMQTSCIPYTRLLMNLALLALLLSLAGCQTIRDTNSARREASSWGSYPIVGTGQTTYWGTDGKEMAAPVKESAARGGGLA